MSNEQKHTPTPWFVGDPIRNADCIGINHAITEDGERYEYTVAEVLPTTSAKVADVDAEFIVRAVNNHDALVRSLEMLTAYAAQYTRRGCLPDEGAIVDEFNANALSLDSIVAQARVVLELATK